MQQPSSAYKPRLWVPGDWNAFFGLGTNVLLNVLVLSSLVLFVIKLPNDIVFGRILPALGIALPIGNLYYAYLAYRLGRKEGRDDVAAMPYGPSVPHYFFVTFVIMLPVVIKTNGDVMKAWEAGLAWAFFIGIVVLIGAFIGPTIRRYTPRAAMLGTLAGISVAFISMSAAFEMWNAAWIALATFAIGGGGGYGMWNQENVGHVEPFTVTPVALAPATALTEATIIRTVAPNPPLLTRTRITDTVTSGGRGWFGTVQGGCDYQVSPSFVIGAFADGSWSNIRGDHALSMVTFPFVGQEKLSSSWAVGGRIGYSLATGVVIALICFFGVTGLFLAVIPRAALFPILLFIGLVIGSQAFQTSKAKYAPAIVLALIPNIAQWAGTLVDNALVSAGTNAGKVGLDVLAGNGVLYSGMSILGSGAVLEGLMLGAIAVFVIDKHYSRAIVYSVIASALAFVGLINNPAGLIFQSGANGWTVVGYSLRPSPAS